MTTYSNNTYIYPMIRIDTQQTRARLADALSKLSKQQAAKAQRLALNDAAKWGRTQISRDIRDRYNIPVSRINDPDPKRGLRVTMANTARPDARITGGHTPVNLATLQNTRMVTATGKLRGTARNVLSRRAQGKRPTMSLFVSAEVVKGQRKTIPTAFVLGVSKGQKGASFTGAKAVIFARGSWGKPDFQFAKPRNPISSLHTVSIATAARHSDVQNKWSPKIKQRADKELIRQVSRMIKEAANQ